LRRLDESATKPGTIAALALGIISTLVLGVGAAYPLYQAMTKKRRAKIAPEILRLTEELSQG
jgi:hypothetical protein